MEFLRAFVVGGLFCVAGQLLLDKTKWTPGRILVAFVVAGVVLEAVGLYGPLTDWAGGGAAVPLTGFGSLLAKGVKAAVAEQGLLGAFTGGLTAGPAGSRPRSCAGFWRLCWRARTKRHKKTPAHPAQA